MRNRGSMIALIILAILVSIWAIFMNLHSSTVVFNIAMLVMIIVLMIMVIRRK